MLPLTDATDPSLVVNWRYWGYPSNLGIVILFHYFIYDLMAVRVSDSVGVNANTAKVLHYAEILLPNEHLCAPLYPYSILGLFLTFCPFPFLSNWCFMFIWWHSVFSFLIVHLNSAVASTLVLCLKLLLFCFLLLVAILLTFLQGYSNIVNVIKSTLKIVLGIEPL